MRGQAWSLAAATADGEVIVGRWDGYRRLLGGGLLLLALAVALLAAAGGGLERAAAPAAPSEREILDRVAAAPVGFVENVGQGHRSATHLAQGPGYAFAFGHDGVRVSLAGSFGVGLEFVGAKRAAEAELAGRPSGAVDYLVGERSRWQTGLATYPELVYRELWPGIDMAFTGSGGKLKYEFRLAPGADPSRIQLAYQGAQSLSLGSAGALNVNTKQGVLKDAAPVSYQHIDGRRVPVESSYALGAGTGYGFTTGTYNHNQPLVIDPGLEYSTYLGGAGGDSGFRIDVTGHDAYITGGTPSPDFPVTPDAFDTSYNGGGPPSPTDAFVTRLDTSKAGTAGLEYSTYLGGAGNEFGISIDASRNDAFVTGQTESSDFPVTADAHQARNSGGQDAFVTRLDTRKAGLAGLEYSTFLGGASNDRGFEIVAKGNDAYFTGLTFSPDFPVTPNAYDTAFNGGGPVPSDAIVARIDTGAGSAGLEYSTYLGGGDQDAARGIDVKGHDVFLTGLTGSANFPVTANAYDTGFNGGQPPFPVDAFVTRLDTSKGTAGLEYSTYLGGNGNDVGFALEAEPSGAYLSGEAGPNFPVTLHNAYDTTFAGGGPCSPPPVGPANCDAFVTRLNTRRSGAAGLEYSTYLGGNGGDIARDLTARGREAFVTGVTAAPNFPVTPGAFQQTNAGGQDAFLTRLDTGLEGLAGLEYSTYLGGSAADEGFGIAVSGPDAYLTGPTASPNFPVTPGAFQGTNAGGQDAYVTRLDTGSVGAR